MSTCTGRADDAAAVGVLLAVLIRLEMAVGG